MLRTKKDLRNALQTKTADKAKALKLSVQGLQSVCAPTHSLAMQRIKFGF